MPFNLIYFVKSSILVYEIAIKIWFGFGLWYECDNNVSIFFESKLDAIVYKTLFSEIGENGLAVFSEIGENCLVLFSKSEKMVG